MNEQDVTRVYETLLCSPGMNEPVKLDHKISRKTVLLMSQVLEKGLTARAGEPGIADPESIKELRELVSQSLEKAGLTALNAKLQDIHK
jgi:hypothetical protein